MIDNFSLFLTHGLLLLAAWRLVLRPDLDSEPPPPADESATQGFGARPRGGAGKRDA